MSSQERGGIVSVPAPPSSICYIFYWVSFCSSYGLLFIWSSLSHSKEAGIQGYQYVSDIQFYLFQYSTREVVEVLDQLLLVSCERLDVGEKTETQSRQYRGVLSVGKLICSLFWKELHFPLKGQFHNLGVLLVLLLNLQVALVTRKTVPSFGLHASNAS